MDAASSLDWLHWARDASTAIVGWLVGAVGWLVLRVIKRIDALADHVEEQGQDIAHISGHLQGIANYRPRRSDR